MDHKYQCQEVQSSGRDKINFRFISRFNETTHIYNLKFELLTFSSFLVAKALDKSVDTVLLPTPPFPERTKIFLLTSASFAAITDIAEKRQIQKPKVSVLVLKDPRLFSSRFL